MFVVPSRFLGIKRFGETLAAAEKHGLGSILQKIGLRKGILSNSKTLRPIELRLLFEELGGGFFELAKFLSARHDLLPHHYREELSKIHVNVAPIDETQHVIKSSLGKKARDLKLLSSEPMRANATSQAYYAKYSGKEVVATVRRPGSGGQVKEDLEIIEFVALLAKRFLQPAINVESTLRDFKRFLEEKENLEKKAEDISVLKKLFSKGKRFVVPKILFSSRNLLIIERPRGVPLSHVMQEPGKHKGVNGQNLSREFSELFLTKLLKEGICMEGLSEKRMFSDKSAMCLCGVRARKISGASRIAMSSLLRQANDMDAQNFVKTFAFLGSQGQINAVFSRKISELFSDQASGPRMDVAEILHQAIYLASSHNMPVPFEIAAASNSLSKMDSICTQLDPGFSLNKKIEEVLGKAKKKESTEYARLMISNMRQDIHETNMSIWTQARNLAIMVLVSVLIAGYLLLGDNSVELGNMMLSLGLVMYIYMAYLVVNDIVGRRRAA